MPHQAQNPDSLIGSMLINIDDNDKRVTSFRNGGEVVSLADCETGVPSVMFRSDVIALENEAEARGLVTRADRISCPVCSKWNLYPHDHFWMEDNYLDDIIDLEAARREAWVESVDKLRVKRAA